MPIVEVKLFEGRSVEVKRQIAKEITEVLVRNLKVSEEDVILVFVDLKRENFAQAGRLAAEASS